jgi:hypothetical protein
MVDPSNLRKLETKMAELAGGKPERGSQAEVQDGSTKLACLVQTERLKHGCFGISEKDRVDMLYDVARHFEKIPLVLDRDERPFGSVVHSDLQRLDEGPQPFDVPLDADNQIARRRSRAATTLVTIIELRPLGGPPQDQSGCREAPQPATDARNLAGGRSVVLGSAPPNRWSRYCRFRQRDWIPRRILNAQSR